MGCYKVESYKVGCYEVECYNVESYKVEGSGLVSWEDQEIIQY